MTPADMEKLVASARGHHGRGRLRRIVLRMEPAVVERVDTLRARWPGATRGAVLRAFTVLGLAMTEDPPKPLPDRCEP